MRGRKRYSSAPQWALPLAIAIVAGTGIGASFAAVATKPAPDMTNQGKQIARFDTFGDATPVVEPTHSTVTVTVPPQP